MSSDVRWSITELLARYDLEPQLADVFVEGSLDQAVLTEASSSAPRRPTFYEVDVVDVPSAVLTKYGLTPGKKQRLLALARELAAASKEAKVECLVDRDLDHWFGPLDNTAHLRWTLFCSIEMHFLAPAIIRDVLIVAGGALITDFDVFLSTLFSTLKTLYCLRLADREKALSVRWLPLRKYLTRNGDAISLDLDKYTTAVLNASSKMAQRAAFKTAFVGWVDRVNGDVRPARRGHDYTEILAWAMNKFGGSMNFAASGAIERLFVLLAKSIPTLAEELG